MRALIVGAGAVGRYVAARLKLAGHDPVLLARSPAPGGLAPEYALRMRGIARWVKVPVAVLGDDPWLRDPFELTALAVKAYSTASAIESVRAIAACAGSTVLTLQNGLGNEEQCAAAFGDDRVVAGALTTAVDKASDGITASDRGGLSIAPLGTLPHNWLIAALALT
ncbi:MAG: NAD(P)-binding protein, partial [Candidatus Eremiobacteraeota bacterium]|nr:NAD(P)-binding protein [Candidatus Eremiobacteraeota bacterium]